MCVACSGRKERVGCQGATKTESKGHHPVVKSRPDAWGPFDPSHVVLSRSHLVEGGGVGGTPGLEPQPGIGEAICLKLRALKGKLQKKKKKFPHKF